MRAIRRPILAVVDIVPLFFHNGERCTVVIESIKIPGRLAFAGGHRDITDLDLKAAAIRESQEEINLRLKREQLKLFMELSTTDRDLRPRYSNPQTPEEAEIFDRLSIVYLVELPEAPTTLKAGDDATNVRIIAIKDLKPEMMGYDHAEVVAELKKYCGIAF